MYTTFNKNYSDINNEPMFFGKNVNTFRTDIKRYSFLNDEFGDTNDNLSDDKEEFHNLPLEGQEFFTKILQFLISVNSTQNRGISIALLQIASLPEIENFVQKCSFIKLNQLLKYNQIVKSICNEPTVVLDNVTKDKNISRISRDFGIYYDLLILDTGFLNTRGEGLYFVSGKERRVNKLNIKKELFLAIIGCYAAECIKNKKNCRCLDFYWEKGLMKQVMLISSEIEEDNDVMINNLKNIINLWKDNGDDPEMSDVYFRFSEEARKIFIDVFNEEILSLEYLFKNDCKHKEIVFEYITDITKQSMKDIGLEIDM